MSRAMAATRVYEDGIRTWQNREKRETDLTVGGATRSVFYAVCDVRAGASETGSK